MSVSSKPRNSSASSSAVVGLNGQIQLWPSNVAMEVRVAAIARLTSRLHFRRPSAARASRSRPSPAVRACGAISTDCPFNSATVRKHSWMTARRFSSSARLFAMRLKTGSSLSRALMPFAADVESARGRRESDIHRVPAALRQRQPHHAADSWRCRSTAPCLSSPPS